MLYALQPYAPYTKYYRWKIPIRIHYSLTAQLPPHASHSPISAPLAYAIALLPISYNMRYTPRLLRLSI